VKLNDKNVIQLRVPQNVWTPDATVTNTKLADLSVRLLHGVKLLLPLRLSRRLCFQRYQQHMLNLDGLLSEVALRHVDRSEEHWNSRALRAAKNLVEPRLATD
jgi:hypothetical protein